MEKYFCHDEVEEQKILSHFVFYLHYFILTNVYVIILVEEIRKSICDVLNVVIGVFC